MIAGHHLEDALAEMLAEAETESTAAFPGGLGLGVRVVPGRQKAARPTSYVAVKADDEEARTQGGLWMVETSVWCVTQSDEHGAQERSKELLRKVARWFGPGCPARRCRRGKIAIHGIHIAGKRGAQADYVFADILDLRCGVEVEG